MKNTFSSLLLLCFLHIQSAVAQPNFPKNAKEAVLISTDIRNFIEAYESLKNNTDTVQVIQTLYVDRASIGLKEYISRFGLNAETIRKAISVNYKEYNKIGKFYAQIHVTEAEFIKEMEAYKLVIADAIFPPTYLLIADFKGIGQASKFGQLISIERKCVDEPEQLKNIIVHELTHFQQAMSIGIEKYSSIYYKKNNLLDMVLREGAAEFITFNLVRKNVEQFTKLKNYEKNEIVYWKKFSEDIKTQDQSFWLNASYDNEKGIPVQLGYGLGYKIIESYYSRASDKKKALKDILNLEDAGMFMIASNYDPK